VVVRQVEYYMSASTLSGPGGQVFDVDRLSGDVTVVGRVDRELTPVYRLLVSARDRGGVSASSTSADAIVVVRVTDENDNIPTISVNTLLQVRPAAWTYWSGGEVIRGLCLTGDFCLPDRLIRTPASTVALVW